MRERPVHRDHHTHHVHVRGQDLRLRGIFKGALPAELRPAWEDPGDLASARAVGPDPDPVPGDRNAGVERVRKVEELAADGCEDEVAVQAHHPSALVALVGGVTALVFWLGLVRVKIRRDGGGVAVRGGSFGPGGCAGG